MEELVEPTAVSIDDIMFGPDKIRKGYEAVNDTRYEKRYEWVVPIYDEKALRVMINYRLVKEISDSETWTSLIPTERLDLMVDIRHTGEFEWHAEPLHKGELKLLNETQGRGVNHFVHTTAILPYQGLLVWWRPKSEEKRCEEKEPQEGEGGEGMTG